MVHTFLLLIPEERLYNLTKKVEIDFDRTILLSTGLAYFSCVRGVFNVIETRWELPALVPLCFNIDFVMVGACQ